MLVGRYQLMFRLGKGGMGEVWAASTNVAELGFQKLIALKVLRTTEMASNAAVMFLDEARAAAVLQHAAIVPTVDLGREGDLLFLAMDMVRGPSLTALLQKLVINKAVMSPAVVAHIGIQIASALDYANGRASFQGRPLKLIHRDVSPHNVLLDTYGAVRLTDFGVARTTIQNHESHVGTVRGKPSYMAPEQVVGGEIDARTDLFSLGIVLYESASLKRLFGRSNPVKSMDAVLKHQPKPLVELVPGFPPELWSVIEQALKKDPAERFQNAAEFGNALSNALHALDGAEGAQRELARLIGDNFSADAFAIDARVKEVEHLSASVAAAAARAPARATSMVREDGTRAMRPRGASTVARSGSLGGAYVADAFGTQAAWPTASAPDPLAPEAIEEARTKFAALTPSGVQVMNMAYMQTAPSAESITPFSGNVSASSMSLQAMPAPKGTSPILIGGLVAAALLLLGTAVVVVNRQTATLHLADPATPVAQEAPGQARIEQKPTAAQQQVPTLEAATAAELAEADANAELAREDAERREAERAKRAAKKAATTAVANPPADGREERPAVAPAVEANATRTQVLQLIRRVKEVDPEAAKQMYPTLNEAGDDNVKVLNELRARAESILASRK